MAIGLRLARNFLSDRSQIFRELERETFVGTTSGLGTADGPSSMYRRINSNWSASSPTIFAPDSVDSAESDVTELTTENDY